MSDILGEICDELRGHLELPSGGILSGFNTTLDEGRLAELHPDASEEIPIISAVDGGSNTIIKTPTVALVLNRVYYNQFLGLKKMDHFELATFLSKTEIAKKEGRGVFVTKIYPIEGSGCPVDPIEIDLKDQSLMVGNCYGEMSRALSMARRFCEWIFARRAVEAGAECVVMDGALQTAFKGETLRANELYDLAAETGTAIAGLSKSSTIYLEGGFPIAGTVDGMARRKGYKMWIIELGRSEEWAHRATVFYTKLHEDADRAYRLDVYERATREQLERLLRGLIESSAYFGYPGYPYPLIDAHAYAKVSRSEADNLKAQLIDRLSADEAEKLELMERAMTGHDILDSLGG